MQAMRMHSHCLRTADIGCGFQKSEAYDEMEVHDPKRDQAIKSCRHSLVMHEEMSLTKICHSKEADRTYSRCRRCYKAELLADSTCLRIVDIQLHCKRAFSSIQDKPSQPSNRDMIMHFMKVVFEWL